MLSLLNTIASRFTPQTLKKFDQKVFKPSDKVISESDRDKILAIAYRSNATAPNTGNNALEYFQGLSKKKAVDRIENDRIISMAPEISLAASIMIPSIMAPNDLREDKIPITCALDGVDPVKIAEISEYATNYFEEKFHLSTTVPKWIYEAMYRSGSKPLLIIPLTTLYKKLTDKDAFVASTEGFIAGCEELDRQSLYGFGDTSSKEYVSQLSASVESFSSNEVMSAVGATKVGKTERSSFSAAHRKFVESVISTESLNISDNPDSINLNVQRNKRAAKTVKKKVMVQYKEAPLETLSADKNAEPTGEPVFMELPTESVIPIYTPGTPNDHIGYFIILDEYGHPLNVQDYDKNNFNSAADAPTQTNFSQMYAAYGYDPTDDSQAQRNQNTVSTIYQSIVETHLKNKAASAGFADIGLGADSSIYRGLFTRYLQQRRTRLMFIPKELLVYFCFKHASDGTGVSKLEDLKFILSLRISNLVSRAITAFNNAIDRKTLNINFAEGFVGNPIEVMRNAERESIRKDAITFSNNPQDIAQTLTSKGYSIKCTGISGLPDWSVTKEVNDRAASGNATPDTDLADDIRNMEILGLEVPPAALNSLNDAEFSRSVATTNIIFSRKLVGYQNITESYVDMFIRTYATFDAEFRKEVAKLLASVDNKVAREPGTVVSNDTKVDVDEIIQSLHFSLPTPNIAPDTTQFDNMNNMITSLGTIVDNLQSDDLAGSDDTVRAVFTANKSLAKSDVIRQYMQKIGFTDIEFPDISKMPIDKLLAIRQSLANAAKAFKAQDALFNPPEDPNAPGGDQTPDSFGADNTDDTGDFGASTGDDGLGDDTDTDANATGDDTGAAAPDADAGGGTTDTGTASGAPTGDEPDAPTGGSLV